MENKEIFRSLVGSHNYNLNTIESDKDYKVFILPSFEDLYYSKYFSKTLISDTIDLDVHDIRKLSSLLYKSNINFMEILFSKEIIISSDLSIKIKNILNELFKEKSSIATINLPYFYKACIGMFFNKRKSIDKFTKGTKHLFEKYNMDTKQALHCYRVLDVLERFGNNEFTDFKQAITYKENESNRELLLSIKNGKFSRKQIDLLLDSKYKLIENNYKKLYCNKKINNDLYLFIEEAVKEIIKIQLTTI